MNLPDVKRREYTSAAKHRAARIKTPGAFLNNATRWPGNGRTSGMRCVIAIPGMLSDQIESCFGNTGRSERRLNHPWTLGPRRPWRGTLSSSARVPSALCLCAAVRFPGFKSFSRLKCFCKFQMRLPDVKRREHTPAAKHRAARIKTPGAFLNNATRWPGNGRTTGMRCVIARAELSRDGGFASLRKAYAP